MTGNRYLLDTNIIIDIFLGNHAVAEAISKLPEIHISATILGELLVGIHRTSGRAKHEKKLAAFLKLCTVIDIDNRTSDFYGKCMAKLYKKGKPIPTNDVWIAATAIQHKLQLVTNDKHFSEIDEVESISWQQIK